MEKRKTLIAMKRYLLLLAAALLFGIAAHAQSCQITESGWGRIKDGISIGHAVQGRTIGEMNIPRWRKTPGGLKIDFDKKEAVISLNGKKPKPYNLMTESQRFQTRDGWSYVEYEALDERNGGCRFWICKHESGAERLLIMYPFVRPDTVYGYMLVRE